MTAVQANAGEAVRVSLITIFINAALAVFKLAAGVLAHSGAMVSDAADTASDVLSTFVVIAGVKSAGRERDKEHPYGHERMECVAALLLSALLCASGVGIGYMGVAKTLAARANPAGLAMPGMLALVAAAVSIAVKEGMYWYTRAAAHKVNSGALMADAWHHRSDALSSVGSLVGIAGARLGVPILDPIASVAISALIVKAAVRIFLDAVGKMTDRACDDETVRALRAVILGQEGVLGVDQLRTRLFGNRIYVDVEISAQAAMTLLDAHDVAQRTHDAIEADFPQVKHCMVHVNPAGEAR